MSSIEQQGITVRPYTIHRDGQAVAVALGEDPRDAISTFRCEELPRSATYIFIGDADIQSVQTGTTYSAR